MKIKSVLIANRGEPVRRAIQTLRRLGIDVITVATPEERTAPWVSESDRCVTISSYLAGDEIIEAAKKTGAQAIWPAWGFLAEQASFAESVIDNRLIWIGPPPDLIAKMGSKSEATEWAKKAGLTTIPEVVIHVGAQSAPPLQACRKMKFPILLKPALGGGGQGQKIIRKEEEMAGAWEEVCRINAKQFGGGPILVQRYFEEARHIETQILADQQGTITILKERDCSIQRRNQKVIEESPSPALNEKQRQKLIQLSLNLARTIGYQSAGTIEYLYTEGEFYFLEMNTRLQVEHPVTEETIRVKGKKIDLIEKMIRIAAGEKLGFKQADITQEGHAIEARLYAEDPREDFRPSPGTLTVFKIPSLIENLRVDSAFTDSFATINPQYDPMIAKIISWGKDRSAAIEKLKEGLTQTMLLGLPTNVGLCENILSHSRFIKGKYSTAFLAQHKELRQPNPGRPGLAMALTGALQYIEERRQARKRLASGEFTSLAHILRLLPSQGALYHLSFLEKQAPVSVAEESPHRFRVELLNRVYTFDLFERGKTNFTCFSPEGDTLSVHAVLKENRWFVFFEQNRYEMVVYPEGEEETAHDPHVAPMAGQVVALLVKEGDLVVPRQELFQIESMKMITTLRAAYGGTVAAVLKAPGDPVKTNEPVVRIPPKESKERAEAKNLWEEKDLEKEALSTGLDDLTAFQRFFHGFDFKVESLKKRLETLPQKIEKKIFSRKEIAQKVAGILEDRLIFMELLTEHTHILTFLAEKGSKGGQLIPKETTDLLNKLLPHYGIANLTELDEQPRPLLHFFQAYHLERRAKKEILAKLLLLCSHEDCLDSSLAKPLTQWLKTKPTLERTVREDLLKLLFKLDLNLYHEIEQLPVAPEYLDEYHTYLENPSVGVTSSEYHDLLKQLTDTPITADSNLSFEEIPAIVRDDFKKWFSAFKGRSIRLPKKMRKAGLHLFELRADHPETGKKIEPWYLMIGLVPETKFVLSPEGTPSLPALERAAIEAYRTVRLVQGLSPHQGNHAILCSTSPTPIPWRTRDTEEDKTIFTPQLARKIAARVSGFAIDIEISATEVILPLLNEESQKTDWTIIEVRHVKPFGAISRPPFLLSERKPEIPLDREKQLDQRQYRMGKLLNRDRAHLLFDGGLYEELFFPEVDDPGVEVGLNVYQGTVHGVPTLAYASDFRFRGGALGEREGKKLAMAVLLGYFTGRAVVACHDGAGANIKESVASLGWAGTYFGAIANTGGFSDKEKFRHWFNGHLERPYFEKCLRHFHLIREGSEEEIQSLINSIPRQLIHFHLHIGATVGMLVYGASISHLSLMNDHPEAYRVLTGAATVARVMGEQSSNYLLGGAKAHGEISGDIEMTFANEEEVIDQTRRMLKFFYQPKENETTARILRNPKRPPLSIPKEAGVIFARDTLCSHIDHGEFFETRPHLKRGGGILTGYVSLANQPVAIAATTTDYGLSHPKAFKKVTLLVEAAQDLTVPFLVITGVQWQALSRPVTHDWLQARAELSRAIAQLSVPKISLALGPRSIEQILHQRMDLVIYVQRGTESTFELNRVEKMTPFRVTSLEEGFDLAARLVRYLPKQPLRPGERQKIETQDPINRDIHFQWPKEIATPYEMRDVIRTVFDTNSFLELWKGDKLPLITGLASLGGTVVGLIADAPNVEGGAQNAESVAKFTRLHRLCHRFGLPLIELNDSPAFRPGQEQEHGGIQGEGGKSLREESLSRIPKVAVTLRQNYGGRFIHANLITLGPPRAGLALEGARIGVMGAKGAVGVLYGKKLASLPESDRKKAEEKWCEEYEKNQLNPENTMKLGYIFPAIQPLHLRQEIVKRLDELVSKK
ncbi:MAG: carboxyl transferase domain-containing protein [bacterium]|nr:carboxyl transferase domain-containing protein [bacterium]